MKEIGQLPPFSWPRLLLIGLLLLQFGLAIGSARSQTPTIDEQGFLIRGLAYLRDEHRGIRVGHPLGLNALNAALLAPDETVKLPIDDPSWQGTSFHRPAELFLWEIGNDVAHVIFLARLPTVWLALLLTAVIGRWAKEISNNKWASLLAVSLIALDPNLLAHASLTTTDLGLAAAATFAGFTLWRFLQQPSWATAALAGAAFGLLQNTKFTAALFVPLFGLVILHWLRQPTTPTLRRLLPYFLAYAAAALLTLWACYGFDIGTLPQNLPTLPQLSGQTVPLAHHLEQLLDIGGRLQVSTPSFLIGRYSDSGWWYYFPVAFLLKTPLPTLILLLWAMSKAYSRYKQAPVTTAVLLIPPLGYLAIATTSSINLGYRHLLPMLPFLIIFIASSPLPAPAAKARWQLTSLLPLLPVWLAIATLLIAPHFLAFFNLLAGGPNNGWKYLVDSNLDWGQDLAGLKSWMDAEGVEHIWLSYFGEARPDYYGISYSGLDSFPPRLMNPQARPFAPSNPAPGFYVISATNLQGVLFENHHLFSWFRQQRPLHKIGYSIFIYQVPATGTATSLALSDLQLDELQTADYAQLNSNQVTPLWFNASQSLIIAPTWLALGQNQALDPLLQPLFQAATPTLVSQNESYKLYQMSWSDQFTNTFHSLYQPEPIAITLSQDSGQISLSHSVSQLHMPQPGSQLLLLTVWQQQAQPQPVKIFIHLAANEQIVAQWDGLDVAWEGWRQGYTLYQTHHLNLPSDLAPGSYQLWAGLYHPDTMRRWQVANDANGRIAIGQITIHE